MLDDLTDDFVARDLFLHLALGLIARLRGWRTLLDEYAHGGAGGGDAQPGDQALIDFSLGLIVFERRAFALLERVPPAAPPPNPVEPPAPPSALLR